jgi:hypothetical protein
MVVTHHLRISIQSNRLSGQIDKLCTGLDCGRLIGSPPLSTDRAASAETRSFTLSFVSVDKRLDCTPTTTSDALPGCAVVMAAFTCTCVSCTCVYITLAPTFCTDTILDGSGVVVAADGTPAVTHVFHLIPHHLPFVTTLLNGGSTSSG